MSSATAPRCAFCEHLNPPSAKYCNECAADLQLTLCGRCSAVNRRDRSHCHKCGVALPQQEHRVEQAASVPVSELAVSEAPPPQQQRRSPAIPIALLAVAAVAAVLLLTDRMPRLQGFDLRSAAAAFRLDADSSESPTIAAPEHAAPPPASAAASPPVSPAAPPEPAPLKTKTASTCTDAAAALSLCDPNAPNEQK
jgi:hypothetical protein